MARGLEKGLEKVIEKGIEKVLEKGIEKGIEKEKINIAKNSISQGLDDKTISLITGLTIQQIKLLRDNSKI
jgi:predicted transposase/invertase (TIGR01784 family)